jgi:hypothetical protein
MFHVKQRGCVLPQTPEFAADAFLKRAGRGSHFEMLSPCLIQPGNALMQPLGLGDQVAGFRFEQGQLPLVRTAIRRQRAMQPHLIFAELALKQRALVKQPGPSVESASRMKASSPVSGSRVPMVNTARTSSASTSASV